jgi:hypothetical protein
VKLHKNNSAIVCMISYIFCYKLIFLVGENGRKETKIGEKSHKSDKSGGTTTQTRQTTT